MVHFQTWVPWLPIITIALSIALYLYMDLRSRQRSLPLEELEKLERKFLTREKQKSRAHDQCSNRFKFK